MHAIWQSVGQAVLDIEQAHSLAAECQIYAGIPRCEVDRCAGIVMGGRL